MRLPFIRSAAISLALCAMVLRALLPDGWMPSAGAAPFVICAADAMHHGGKSTPAKERTHAPCAFAAAAPLAPPAQIAAHIGIARVAVRSANTAAAGTLFPAPAHRPHAPRAPPAFS